MKPIMAKGEPNAKRKTLVERQAEEGAVDPFAASERVVSLVQKNMTASAAKYRSVQEAQERMHKELRLVERERADLQRQYDKWLVESTARKNEHDRLVDFLDKCQHRELEIKHTCRDWKTDQLHQTSRQLKLESRENLQQHSGFYRGPGSTFTRKQFLERQRLTRRPPSTQSLPQLHSTGGGRFGDSMLALGATK
eukprot:FR738139.1.p1 GENE.FR738139.1~~FR738139.1.p1  ORF type:complete len:195 (+),score=11.08 FR738139.1:59-643(+)